MAERVDWVEILDPRTEELMFANTKTGECLWEPPPAAKVKRSNTNQWWELYDEKTRRYYYYNAHTKQTEWRKPKESDIITLAKLQSKGKGSKRRSSSSKKDGSRRRTGSSSSRRESTESRGHRDSGERGSMPRKYSRHNSRENLNQIRKHSSRSSARLRDSTEGVPNDEGETAFRSERKESESRMESDSARSSIASIDMKEAPSVGAEVQLVRRTSSKKAQNSSRYNDKDQSRPNDIDLGTSSQDMDNTTRNIGYLNISGEILDEPTTYDTSFSIRNPSPEESSGRTSNCSINHSNYVSDGPLSESETSALNDSFYSCDSKFADSDERLEIIMTEAQASNENEDEVDDELPRTTSFFNKMLDKKGNLRPVGVNKVKLRHTRSEGQGVRISERTDSGSSTGSTGLVLRGDKSGRRRSNSLDNKAYDNISYSVYDNLNSPTNDEELSGDEDTTLTEKLTSGGMPPTTAALVEACDPSPESEAPAIQITKNSSPAGSPSKGYSPRHQVSDSVLLTKNGEENGLIKIVVCRPVRPPPPLPIQQHLRVTKPMTRSNTCPTSPSRTPVVPKLPSPTHKFTEFDLNEQRRGLFGKKEHLLAYSKAPIKKPVINTRDKKIKKEAIEIFKLVLIYMGDKITRNKPDNVVLWEIVTKAWASPPLRDELFFQLIKQTTENSSSASLKLGWELMAVCLAMFPPSTKYQSYLEGYVYSHLKDNQRPANPILEQEITNQIAHFAENCHHKLEKMSKTGCRKGQRQPTQAEVDAAKRAIFHPSMFGSTLEDTMLMQKVKFPERELPWILTCLTEQIIKHDGTYTEGIFRVPGDIDEVNALKVKTDNWSYPDDVNDPNVAASLLKQWFRELKEPVIDEKAYEKCISSCDDETLCTNIVLTLPKHHRLVLCHIIRFLQKFCKPEVIARTKMDVNNLAMVWAPNFLRCPSNEPQVIFENTRKEMTFVRTILNTLDTSIMDSIKRD